MQPYAAKGQTSLAYVAFFHDRCPVNPMPPGEVYASLKRACLRIASPCLRAFGLGIVAAGRVGLPERGWFVPGLIAVP